MAIAPPSLADELKSLRIDRAAKGRALPRSARLQIAKATKR